MFLHFSADVLEMFPSEEVGNIRQAISQKLSNTTKIFFHFLTCFTLCFYFLCAHEHMFYYGMCAVPNVQK